MSASISPECLEFFTKIVDCGGLSEATAQLNVSPFVVSKSLIAMEGTLGTILIKRTARSITLTDAGQHLFNRANKLLKKFDETLNTTSGYYHSPQDGLHITYSITFGYSWLVNLVDKYHSQFPDMSLYIDLSGNFVNPSETDFDTALRISTAPPQNYAMHELVPVHWAYCASSGYLAKKGIPQRRSDLVNHGCLICPGLTPVLKVADEQDYLHQLKLYMPIQVNGSLVLLKSVLEDQGVAYLPTYLIGNHIQKEEITPLMLDGTTTYETHTLYAPYFLSKYNNPKVRSFIGLLVAELGPLPAWDNWTPE